jgi:hypothetical protein
MKRRKAGRRFVDIFHSLLQGMKVMLLLQNLMLELPADGYILEY